MFNPNITPGPWGESTSGDNIIGTTERQYGNLNIAHIILIDDWKENRKAIAAVPQLLQVYKAAKKLNDSGACVSDKYYGLACELDDAIKKLEERNDELLEGFEFSED